MPKIDLSAIAQSNATSYPKEYAAPVAGRWHRRLGPLAGLTHFGASQVVLKPGAWSSQRHWHTGEDEMLIMLSGEAVLVEDAENGDDGRTLLRAGDICVWPAGRENGHHLRNESAADCSYVAISGGPSAGGGYSDIDMLFTGDNRYIHKDGREYPAKTGT